MLDRCGESNGRFYDRRGDYFREGVDPRNHVGRFVIDKSTIRACMDAINDHIKHGPLSGNGCDKTAERNGMILAFNTLSDLANG